MKVNYSVQGEEGKNCGICAHFRPTEYASLKGTCFGREVTKSGGCGFFKGK
ncbi:MAG: hypothetical protein V1676_06080 [Candidatus Diapherotrites archaeon]